MSRGVNIGSTCRDTLTRLVRLGAVVQGQVVRRQFRKGWGEANRMGWRVACDLHIEGSFDEVGLEFEDIEDGMSAKQDAMMSVTDEYAATVM